MLFRSTDAGHPERDDPDPSGAIESIELQSLWNQRPNYLRTDRPMQKQQIVPDLPQQPITGWDGPGPVRDLLQRRVREHAINYRVPAAGSASRARSA